MNLIREGLARRVLVACLALVVSATATIAADKPGDIRGSTLEPTPDNLAATWSKASLVLPPALAGGQRWQGLASAAPDLSGKVPLVILLHGSSGIAAAIKDFQVWRADILGLASVAQSLEQGLRRHRHLRRRAEGQSQRGDLCGGRGRAHHSQPRGRAPGDHGFSEKRAEAVMAIPA